MSGTSAERYVDIILYYQNSFFGGFKQNQFYACIENGFGSYIGKDARSGDSF